MNNITRIGLNCTGCTACVCKCPKDAITMEANKEGFFYPKINDNCIDCGICLKVCQVNQEMQNDYVPQYLTMKPKIKGYAKKSASAGISKALAEDVISRNGVVYGCAFDENVVARQISISNRDEIHKIQSSKYVQSQLGNTYLEVKRNLEAGVLVLFTGTPCQVAGLKMFLGRQYDNLYTADIICHGVPSPKLLSSYINWFGHKKGAKVTNINFRFKGKNGWEDKLVSITTDKKVYYIAGNLSDYMIDFMSGKNYRESCYNCKFSSLNRVSDITMGDYWGVHKYDPKFVTKEGVSCIIINSKKGEELFDNMQTNFEFKYIDSLAATYKQGNLISPTNRPKERDDYYKHDNLEIHFAKKRLNIKKRIQNMIPIFVKRYLKKLK